MERWLGLPWAGHIPSLAGPGDGFIDCSHNQSALRRIAAESGAAVLWSAFCGGVQVRARKPAQANEPQSADASNAARANSPRVTQPG